MDEVVVPVANEANQLGATLTALADPTRRAIVERLASGEATVTELAEPFAISMPAISRHLKVLEEAGLIARSRHAQWRPCRLRPEALNEVSDWVTGLRDLYAERFDQLDEYLHELKAQEGANNA